MDVARPDIGEIEVGPEAHPESAHDLAIVIVAIPNQNFWFRACLPTILQHTGDVTLDVVVAENGSTDGTQELIENEFPWARVVECDNKGFAHGNNRALLTCHARYVLFLNPDTEILEGTFADLIDLLDKRPEIGLAGVKQVGPSGALSPTIRRFPSALRSLWEALGSESFPFRASWLGERELDPAVYDQVAECDWTAGSFMIARREALESAGLMDERFFLYSEEPDLCIRMKQAGWKIVHLPNMTILHHASKGGVNPKMLAQDAYSRKQYARKHFSRLHRFLYYVALSMGYLRRWALGTLERCGGRQRRLANVRALSTLWGWQKPPFGSPPRQALPVEPRRWR